MSDVTIRIHIRQSDGEIVDTQSDFGLPDFGGVLPSVGDTILDPGVVQGRDRRDPFNRGIWTVVDRMFNPRDLKDYIALIVEVRGPKPGEHSLLPSH